MQSAILTIVPVIVRYLSETASALGTNVEIASGFDDRDLDHDLFFGRFLYDIFYFFRQIRTRHFTIIARFTQKPFEG